VTIAATIFRGAGFARIVEKSFQESIAHEQSKHSRCPAKTIDRCCGTALGP
jgi:hypothetical protein